MSTQIDAAIERDLAKQQTLAAKQNEWRNFVARCHPNKPMDTLANFTFLVSILETEGKLVTPKNLHAALLANTDYLPDGWDKTGQISAQQQAAQKTQSEQDAKLNAWFENAQAEYGFVDDQHNRNMLVEYLKLHFNGVPSEVALTAFLRENADNPNLHRLAQPASKTLDPETMWLKQNVLRNPAQERDEREAKRAEQAKQFEGDVQSAKARATFQGEMASIRRHLVMMSRGPDHAQSINERIEKLEGLSKKFPAWSDECQREIQKQRAGLRF